jgi:acyl carrier protein
MSFMTKETTADEVVRTLQDIVLRVLRLEIPPGQITAESNLYELGLESLSVVELLTELERAFDIIIEVEDLSPELFEHFGALVEFTRAKLDAAG